MITLTCDLQYWETRYGEPVPEMKSFDTEISILHWENTS